jgi:hypothetical protein
LSFARSHASSIGRSWCDLPHTSPSRRAKIGWSRSSPAVRAANVGHYEDDTLVVDTIGLNDKTFLDNYRTPHSDKLHVIERWRMIEEGKKLEILMTIDDPDTFYQPFQALRQYNRVSRAFFGRHLL